MAALLVTLASGITVTTATLAPIALALHVDASLLAGVLTGLGRLAPTPPVPRTGSGPGSGPAGAPMPERIAASVNLQRRVLFAVNAARRRENGASEDWIVAQTRAHERASRARAGAAQAVTAAMIEHRSLILGWQAIMDRHTTPGCRAANGHNFHAGRPPVVEGEPAFPGWPHGGTCRCRPVAPYPNAKVIA